MKRAALGIRMHSGWGVLVAVSVNAKSAEMELIDRRRIVTTDPTMPGANQPYHYAASLALSTPGLSKRGMSELGLPQSEFSETGFFEAQTYLAKCAAASEGMASAAIAKAVQVLDKDRYRIVGCAVLLASGHPLPSLAKILAAHPLIHTAEGEFFRNAVRRACEGLTIPVTAIRERELEERAKTAFGTGASRMQRSVSRPRSIGPPWTKDHKTAALAAAMILACEQTVASAHSAPKKQK